MVNLVRDNTFEFSLNVFTEFAEFSDKNNIILKVLLKLTLCSLSCVTGESETLPLCHRDTASREDS